MATAPLVPPDSLPTPSTAAALTVLSTDALGERIAALAARLHAATYELLVLLREFDARTDWHGGIASCAHWLRSTPARKPRAPGAPAWRTGIALGVAREKVRVAHALAILPRVSATMQHGAISYAKVRALTRVAKPDNEAAMLDFAQAGTAAHVERFVGAWRRVDRVAAAPAESRHLHRHLSTWVDNDGMVVIRGRLAPEVGAVVQRALEAAADRLFRDGPSPRRRRDACPATHPLCRCVVAPTGRSWMSGEGRAQCRRPFGEHCRHATGIADFQAARLVAATRIMWSTGSMVDLPAWTISSSFAGVTTGLSTREDSS